ncbi:MAG: 50S ribosomal protein L11 methyltransferase, partial [Pseudomonadota bacterium]|nr:50S ribosomal protein L11 methyltransferase [Pseudomonadota bacterium]
GETPLWETSSLVGLFPLEQNLQSLLATLQFHPRVLNRDSLQIEPLEEQMWERTWMEHFAPKQYGKRLWICPSWQSPPDPEAINILLDPGMAFGTGSHATTALCLRWLEQADLRDKAVIDYGCGSGILAIAAARLGADKIHAVDNDPQAIAATVDNSLRNDIPRHKITAYLPEALPKLQADFLLANILAEPLHELADQFANLVKPKGNIVLSGILEEQTEPLIARYGRWFSLDSTMTEDGWVRLSGSRRA